MKSIGKIIYSPRTHLASSEKWAILYCDDEISRYYRHLYEIEHKFLNGGYCNKLTRSVWGAHISFLRNEDVPANLWRTDENKIIEFEYEPGVQSNKEYFWLKVSCPYLCSLREKFGLSKEPRFGYHLTIGRST